MLKPLGQALRSWKPERGRDDTLAAVEAAWTEIVGENVAKNSRPVQLAGDALVVATRSSAWSEQLSLLAERILAALRGRFGLRDLRRLRFRTGVVTAHRPARRVVRGVVSTPSGARGRERSHSVEESVARFRSDVARVRRANAARGSKECEACASLIAPDRSLCVACENRVAQERERFVSRLLFDVPWLGYVGIAALLEGLQREEYEVIRARLLARWWAMLDRARKAKRLSRDGRERLVASSYVIVKSGLEPEQIAPETVRNVLGDELTELLKRHDSE
jgi:hypothetical protein